MKYLRIALFAVAILAAWLSVPAGQSGDFVYSGDGTSITITEYTGAGGEVTLPDMIDGLPVTAIDARAFSNCTTLTGITVPERVASIGDWAFNGCSGLTRVFFQGDAPVSGWHVFGNVTGVTVYHLPGKTGWGSTFGGRPTALWTPPGSAPSAPPAAPPKA